MTLDERVRLVVPFGFTDRQARFVVTVAMHGGFCLRRHYAAFACLRYGQGVRDFLDLLVARRLASRVMFRRDRGLVYHLHAKALYAAIGQDDNRNRRITSPALIARKLMLLDYVLTAPGTDWYATEQDKVALFTTRFNVPVDDLPRRVYRAQASGVESTTRTFVHKLPIAVTGDSPVVSFVVLVTDTTGRTLTQFLDDHARLLARLADWRVVAVCPQHVHGLPACEAAFRQFAARVRQARSGGDIASLRRYFVARAIQERGEIARLSVSDIDALRLARRKYAAPTFEHLYQEWQQNGDAAFSNGAGRAIASAIETGRGQLLTHRLPLRYDRFGTHAGLA